MFLLPKTYTSWHLLPSTRYPQQSLKNVVFLRIRGIYLIYLQKDRKKLCQQYLKNH
jgi:hypothetical protein